MRNSKISIASSAPEETPNPQQRPAPRSAFSARKLRIIEFALIGVVLGITEDLLAIFIATDEPFSFHVLWAVFLVALPFAFFSELVVDQPRFWERLFSPKRAVGSMRASEMLPPPLNNEGPR